MSQAHRIYKMSFASIYPLYIQKAERKGRLKTEVNQIIQWLTGYNEKELDEQLKQEVDFETFIKEAPQLNPCRTLIRVLYVVLEWRTSKSLLCKKFDT